MPTSSTGRRTPGATTRTCCARSTRARPSRSRKMRCRVSPRLRWRELRPSRPNHDLDRLAVVHRAVPVRHVVEAARAVEYAAGLDPALEDVREQLLDVRARRRRAAGDADVLPERDVARDRVLLRDADAADGAARARDLERRDHRLLEPDALEDGMRPVAAGQLPDVLDALVAALRHDVGGAELAGQRDPVL